MAKSPGHAGNGSGTLKQPKKPRELLDEPKTKHYRPYSREFFKRPRDLPPFSFLMLQAMLLEPTIQLGLRAREAPLMTAELAWREDDTWHKGVRAESDVVAQFVARQWARLWRQVNYLTTNQVWGWAACEVTYRLTNAGTVEIDKLLPRHATDTRVLVDESQAVGVRFLRVANATNGVADLAFPRALFCPFQPEPGAWYGTSVLLGAYSPWADKCLDGGANDVRRLFMHKDAYGGLDIGYPLGEEYEIPGKGTITARDVALEIAEQALSGNVMARPSNVFADSGKEKYPVTRATIPGNPGHILQYPKDLDVEMLRGMGIPDDVLTAEATGAWAGKQVPMMAFYAGLQVWLDELVETSDAQVIRRLVDMNFGPNTWYELATKPLARQAMEQQAATPAPQGVGQSQEAAPQRLSLDAFEAVGEGVLSAAELVSAARQVLSQRQRAGKGADGESDRADDE